MVRTVREGQPVDDGAGNLVNDPADDLITQTVYDQQGRRIAEIDALGRRTDFGYDDLGRLTSVTLPAVDNGLTPQADLVCPTYTYGYDAFGNQTSLIDPQGRETRFTFNAQNQQTSRTLPIGITNPTGPEGSFTETTAFFDDPAAGVLFGLPRSSTDFEGNTVTFGYDALGRQTSQTYTNAEGITQRIVNITLDAFGRTVQTLDSGAQGNGTTTNVYDADGRVVERDTPQGTLSYEYDNLGRQTAGKEKGRSLSSQIGLDACVAMVWFIPMACPLRLEYARALHHVIRGGDDLVV